MQAKTLYRRRGSSLCPQRLPTSNREESRFRQSFRFKGGFPPSCIYFFTPAHYSSFSREEKKISIPSKNKGVKHGTYLANCCWTAMPGEIVGPARTECRDNSVSTVDAKLSLHACVQQPCNLPSVENACWIRTCILGKIEHLPRTVCTVPAACHSTQWHTLPESCHAYHRRLHTR